MIETRIVPRSEEDKYIEAYKNHTVINGYYVHDYRIQVHHTAVDVVKIEEEIEKAIESIQCQKAQIGIDYSNNKDMTVIHLSGEQAEKAIKALGKQSPKKPDNIDAMYIPELMADRTYGECPTCRDYVSEIAKHCCNCGQALEWGNE